MTLQWTGHLTREGDAVRLLLTDPAKPLAEILGRPSLLLTPEQTVELWAQLLGVSEPLVTTEERAGGRVIVMHLSRENIERRIAARERALLAMQLLEERFGSPEECAAAIGELRLFLLDDDL